MSNSFAKLPLSGSSYGKQILLTTTASSVAIPIHTVPEGTDTTDEVWLYAYNNDSTTAGLVSVLWGGTTEPDDVVKTSIEARTGRNLIVDGKLLQNGLTISAYADTTGSILIDGFVNRITPG